jgi:glutamine amidotransferase
VSEWITIVDYGMGNIGSLRNMFKRIGHATELASTPEDLRGATKILLPGVGAFDPAMERLAETGLGQAVRDKALVERVPTLGICLGMQLLGDGSEEGERPGLSLIPARARRFPTSAGKVPHMGWNEVVPTSPSPLTAPLPPGSRFYFVHSYYMLAEEPADAILTCTYGVPFHAAIQRGNVYGAQFHPEKSHRFGMALLKAFAELPC